MCPSFRWNYHLWPLRFYLPDIFPLIVKTGVWDIWHPRRWRFSLEVFSVLYEEASCLCVELQDCTLTMYCVKVNYRLCMYTTDDVIAEYHDETVRLIKPPNKTLIKYPEFLWMEALHCSRVKDGKVHKPTYLKDSRTSSISKFSCSGLWTSMRSFKTWFYTRIS